MRKPVAVVGPSLKEPGGVSNFYRVVFPYLEKYAEYYELGGRGSARRYELLRDFQSILRMLRDREVRIVQVNPSMRWASIVRDALLMIMISLYGKKSIVFFRGWNDAVGDVVCGRFSWFFRHTYGKADYIWVLGTVFEKKLRSCGFRMEIGRITTIVPKEYIDVGRTAVVKREVKGSARKCVFLFISRLDHGKGVIESIDIVAELIRRTGVDIHLRIAGDGPMREDADNYVEKHGYTWVEFCGHISGDQKLDAFINSDVLIFPTSYGEGMPNAIVEALGAALPVVTRPVGGIPDLLRTGENGIIENDLLSDRSMDCLSRLVMRPELRAEYGRRNVELADEFLRADKVAGKLLAQWQIDRLADESEDSVE